MNIYESIYKIREMAKYAIDAIKNEEATKTALILPMLTALGYDVFNPKELIPEMDCDLTRSGDKIDYAIASEGQVRILIECKHHNVNLSLHSSQLKKYYAASEARCGILTNGLEYWFYSDTIKANIMDDTPFFKFSLAESTNEDIQHINMFSKGIFNEDKIALYIQEKEFKNKVLEAYKNNVTRMSEQFISMLLSSAGIEQTKENITSCREIIAAESDVQLKADTQTDSNSILEAIRSISSSAIDGERLFSIRYKSHEVVFIDNQSKWICRVYPDKRIIVFPPAGEYDTKDYSGVPADLLDYKELFIKAIKSYS